MGVRTNRYPGIDPVIVRIIRRKAAQLRRRREFAEYTTEDLEQELILHVLRRQEKFEPTRSKLVTFVSRIIENRAATLIEHHRAAKRDCRRLGGSLNETVPLEGDSVIERMELVDGKNAMRSLGWQVDPDENQLDLAIDLDRATDRLPPTSRKWAMRLAQETITEASQVTGVPRSTIYDERNRIRRRYDEDGLRDYL